MSNTQSDETSFHHIDLEDNNMNQNSTASASHSTVFEKFDKQKRDTVIYWGEICIFILGVTLCILSFSVQSFKQTSIRGFAMWQLCLLITALLGGPVLSKAISHAILLCIKGKYSAKEDLMYYVIGLVQSAWVVVWFGLIFLAWNWVVDEPSYLGVSQENKAKILRKFDSTERFITLTLTTILLGSALWLLKDLLIMIGKSSFHIRRFFDRIRESLIHEYWIKALSIRNPDPRLLQNWKKLTCEMGKVCGKKENRKVDLSALKDVNQEDVSCWTMKVLIHEIVRERALVFYKDDHQWEKDDNQWEKIKDENDIDDAANLIYSNLGYIDVQQLDSTLSKYFDKDEVPKVSQWLLEGAESKQVNKETITKCLTRAWKFRRSLIRALQDNKLLFRDLNRFVDVVLVIIIFLVWLVMLNVEIRRAMLVVGSAIVGSAFVIGDFCKKILDDFTFIFVVHPFDVGDSCLIQETLVTIENITLLTTMAMTLEGELRSYPNSLLCTLPITNYTRSLPPVGDSETKYTRSLSPMGDSVDFFLHIATSPIIIEALKTKIKNYIHENSHYWHQDHELEMKFDPQDSTRMKATLHVKHAISYYDYDERQIRKSQLISHLMKYLQELKLVPL